MQLFLRHAFIVDLHYGSDVSCWLFGGLHPPNLPARNANLLMSSAAPFFGHRFWCALGMEN